MITVLPCLLLLTLSQTAVGDDWFKVSSFVSSMWVKKDFCDGRKFERCEFRFKTYLCRHPELKEHDHACKQFWNYTMYYSGNQIEMYTNPQPNEWAVLRQSGDSWLRVQVFDVDFEGWGHWERKLFSGKFKIPARHQGVSFSYNAIQKEDLNEQPILRGKWIVNGKTNTNSIGGGRFLSRGEEEPQSFESEPEEIILETEYSFSAPPREDARMEY